MKIGFFDSGLGGLMILKAVREYMPEYDYLYYGDTKNLPYGDKSEAEIYELTKEAVITMFERGVLIGIIACNTASVESLRRLQDTLLVGKYANRKLLGVVIPTVEVLVEKNIEHALLIGTLRTASSGKYERELIKLNGKTMLTTLATPELVPLIEKGLMNDAEAYLEMVLTTTTGKVDAVILGCTHYIGLKDHMRSAYEFEVISQDEIIPKKLHAYLERHQEIKNILKRTGGVKIVVTEEEERYSKFARALLGVPEGMKQSSLR